MLAKPPRYDCYSGDSTEYAWHNKAHSCIMPKNPREAAVEVCFYVSRDFFDCASRRRRHKRRLMLNGKRQKSLDLLFPVVQCIGPRYRRSRSIRCWDFGKRPERKSLLALESISLPFNFLCLWYTQMLIAYPMFSSNEVWLYISHLFRRSSVVSTGSAAAERPKVSS